MPEEPAKLDETADAPAYRPPAKPPMSRRRRWLLLGGGAPLVLVAAGVITYLVVRPDLWKYGRGTIVPGVPDPVVHYTLVDCGLAGAALQEQYPGVGDVARSPKVTQAFRDWLASPGPWKKDNWTLAWRAMHYVHDDPALLRTFLKHGNASVRHEAYRLLAGCSIRNPSGQEEFFRLLQAMLADRELRPMAFSLVGDYALNAGRPPTVAAGNWAGDRACYIAFLLPLLNDADADMRKLTTQVLGRIGDPGTTESLTALLQDRDEQVRLAAGHALAQRGDARACPLFIPLLKSGDPSARAGAAAALGQIRAPEAIDALIGALLDSDYGVRVAAAGALRHARGTLADDLKRVDKLAGDLTAGKTSAEAAVAELGGRDHALILLKIHLFDTEIMWTKREQCLELLGRCGKPAVPVLARIVLDKKDADKARCAAAAALGLLGPEAGAAVPDLITVLADDDIRVRRRSAEALGRIGQAAAAAVAALERSLKDDDAELRTAASEALRKIKGREVEK
ncbi:MAG TPA: HEAT repeat domain-containing protein [Planctomycetota bacterium]|nr:HEAT repeat domain-containing protein [Planctomycetota bacterium]